MSHLYQISLSCVTGDFLQLTFKVVGRGGRGGEGREGRGREGGWGQKVLSRPSADSFAVGRRQKWHRRSPVCRNQSPNLPNLTWRRRRRKNPNQSPQVQRKGSAKWKKAKANKARNKRKQNRKISGPLFPVSLRISGADQGSLLSLKEWRNAHTAASTWLLDALLGQTQAILSEIKVEE
jgi:hypothetical protein